MLFSYCLLTSSCKKQNQAPSCEITSPLESSEFVKGETITINVTASDPDGSVKEVVFSIDGIVKFTSSSSPYSYDWLTSGEDVGNHVIDATVVDNENKEQSDDCTISIIVSIPSISTKLVTTIMGTSAVCGGDNIFDGGGLNTAKGVCWSTNQNPTIADNFTMDGIGLGAFSSNLTNLIPNTT